MNPFLTEGTTRLPHVLAGLNADRTATLTIGSALHTEPDIPSALTAIAAAAAHTGTAVRVTAADANGDSVVLIVTPAGSYYPADNPSAVSTLPADQVVPPETLIAGLLEQLPAPASAAEQTLAPPPQPPAADVDEPSLDEPVELAAEILPLRVPAAATATRAPGAHRASFIQERENIIAAKAGWRGSLNRLGLRLEAGDREKRERDDVRVVAQHWPGPRTIAIGNPKGSANKTPTTAMLSAVFARHGGAGVLAWDNNETRGSLAWRTQTGAHAATVLDLLPRVEDLLSPAAQAAELSHFTHHQVEDKYDVLRSDQSVDGDHEVTANDVDRIHQVAARYYRLIVMDSGNNERAANWRAMIDRANVLVVPVTNSEDTAEAGARMLESLGRRDQHSRELAENAVAIISQRTPGKDANMDRIVRDFAPLVREVAVIPHDPAMRSGVIHYDALRPATQRAWLAAAAAVARGL